ASAIAGSNVTGISFVIAGSNLSCNGIVLSAASLRLFSLFSAVDAELLAIHKAFQCCLEWGISIAVLECDVLKVIQRLKSHTPPVDFIFDDVKSLLNLLVVARVNIFLIEVIWWPVN
ncbi:hypothetical protein TorRG33x02_152800, partial [Trema orientale]